MLAEVYWEGIGALLHNGYDAHMGICDGGQANRTFILLHFESEEEADRNNYTTANPYNDKDHVFMMDPSVSWDTEFSSFRSKKSLFRIYAYI